MNKNNVALALLDNVKAVEVVFSPSNGRYTYMTLLDLEVGDKVVVDTPRSGLVVVTVAKTNADWDIDARYDYKFIVDKVDTAQYDAVNNAMADVKALIEAERKAQARKAVVEQLGLKAATVAKINKLVKL